MEAIYARGGRPSAYLPARGVMDTDAKAFSDVRGDRSSHPCHSGHERRVGTLE